MPHPLLVKKAERASHSPRPKSVRRGASPVPSVGFAVGPTEVDVCGVRESAVTKVLIRVDAKLSDELMSAFPQLMVRNHPAQTTLVGDLSDQDELQGVLNLLRSLGIDIVEILTLPE